MEIPAKEVVAKMEELLVKAKQATSDDMLTGYILAIQALCEVIVNEQAATPSASLTGSYTVKPSRIEPVKIEQENGGSIFDF